MAERLNNINKKNHIYNPLKQTHSKIRIMAHVISRNMLLLVLIFWVIYDQVHLLLCYQKIARLKLFLCLMNQFY